MKERIVLDSREWKLDDLDHEIWQHRAATAALGLEMGDIRHRHVVRELERVQPGLLAIHRAGAEAHASEVVTVVTNSFCTLEEYLAILKELAVVIEIVDVDFEPA